MILIIKKILTLMLLITIFSLNYEANAFDLSNLENEIFLIEPHEVMLMETELLKNQDILKKGLRNKITENKERNFSSQVIRLNNEISEIIKSINKNSNIILKENKENTLEIAQKEAIIRAYEAINKKIKTENNPRNSVLYLYTNKNLQEIVKKIESEALRAIKLHRRNSKVKFHEINNSN